MGKTLISIKAMFQTIRHKKQGVYVELSHLVANTSEQRSKGGSDLCPKELHEVLHRFHLF